MFLRLRPLVGLFWFVLCCQAKGTLFAQVVLRGAGATFPAPLYHKWFAAYSTVDPTVRFDYLGGGSEKGQKLIAEQTVDFGASDGPMSDESLANAPGPILHPPTVGGADVITFNLHGIKDLRLDGPTLARIYLGKITRWNDPAILSQNPAAKLPDEDITVAHRADGSGTTYIFTDYLSSISPEWKLKVGHYLAVNWPVGVGLAGSGAVSEFVKKRRAQSQRRLLRPSCLRTSAYPWWMRRDLVRILSRASLGCWSTRTRKTPLGPRS